MVQAKQSLNHRFLQFHETTEQSVCRCSHLTLYPVII